ncbi:MAG: dTDP-4-dehydrorhamnose reductase [Saprospiraceae bacterium]
MKHILVTGANGQVGRELQAIARAADDVRWIFASREQLDLEVPGAVQTYFKEHRVEVCINCAAYTAVDRAESEPARAERINHHAVAELAAACARAGATLVHFSSDYVYHNTVNRPLREDDPTLPQGVYARTKLAGDLAALRINPLTLILRTSWVYSGFGHNFVKTMLRLGRERGEVRVVSDQIGSPTYARDLASVARFVACGLQGEACPTGIYHYSNEGVCSWFDFARAVFDLSGVPCAVVPIAGAEFPTPARRPAYSVMDKSKFKETFPLPVPYWRDSLQDCLQLLG